MNPLMLYSYIVKHDKGLAPNPFYGYCTLAVCTPNHMGVKVGNGDWIVGFATSARAHKLIYVMKVDERLHFDNYFQDPRFQRKKPNLQGSWKQRCGDNIYYQSNSCWCQLDSPYHYSKEQLRKDTKYPYVFIGREFYYFGDNSPNMPSEFEELIWKRQGCSYNFNPDLVEGFIDWLQQAYKPGKYGEPWDRDAGSCS